MISTWSVEMGTSDTTAEERVAKQNNYRSMSMLRFLSNVLEKHIAISAKATCYTKCS